MIKLLSKNWDFKRLSSVDRGLLRLGVFELLHCPEIPPEVTLNECIELAKSYGTDESAAFVNGILDQVRREQGGAKNPGKAKPAPKPRAAKKNDAGLGRSCRRRPSGAPGPSPRPGRGPPHGLKRRRSQMKAKSLDWSVIDGSLRSPRPQRDCERQESLGICTGLDCLVYESCNFNIKKPLNR